MVRIQENTNKCTILHYKGFTIKAVELRHVSTLYGPSSWNVHQYLYNV